MDTDSESDMSDRPPVDICVEVGELSDQTRTNPPLKKQTYRETMRGIWAYMGWSHIPDMDTTTSTSDDNPFASPKVQAPGKVSVQMPTDDWLWKEPQQAESDLSQRIDFPQL